MSRRGNVKAESEALVPCEPAPVATWVQGDTELTLDWATTSVLVWSLPRLVELAPGSQLHGGLLPGATFLFSTQESVEHSFMFFLIFSFVLQSFGICQGIQRKPLI